MIVIGNNIALSLGMVGALSIVRFRTAIKDPRDTTYIFWAIITGLGITLLVVFGIKAIANFATVFVPLFVIVVIVAAAIILQNHSLTELLTTAPPGPALSLGAATTMVAGGFIAGAICTPDYARFLKNGTQVFWMTLIGTFVGELGMNLLAVLLAHAMGTENIVDIMMGTSGIIGVIIVVASTVKLNDINLYSSSLGLATMINALFNKAISRNGLVWALGIVGTLLSVIGIINYFTKLPHAAGRGHPARRRHHGGGLLHLEAQPRDA